MKDESFTHRTRIKASAEQVFDWHKQPDAFEKLTPPWADVETVRFSGGIQDGAQRELRVKLGPLRRQWLLEHRDYVEGTQFRDVQIQGPFAKWEHTHRFESDGDACILHDTIAYRLPAGFVGRLLGKHFIDKELRRLFDYREEVLRRELEK